MTISDLVKLMVQHSVSFDELSRATGIPQDRLRTSTLKDSDASRVRGVFKEMEESNV